MSLSLKKLIEGNIDEQSDDAGFPPEYEEWWTNEKINYKFPSSSAEQNAYVIGGLAWKACKERCDQEFKWSHPKKV